MTDDTTKRLLRRASEKIRSQRRQIEILEAKQEMIDLFAVTLHTDVARRARGEEIDIAWEIERALEEADKEAANDEGT